MQLVSCENLAVDLWANVTYVHICLRTRKGSG